MAKKTRSAQEPRAVKRKLDPWDVLTFPGLRMQDRFPLTVLISDWLALQRPVKYAMHKLVKELGTQSGNLRSCLKRLKAAGWITYESQKGVNRHGITVYITTETIKTFKLPLPIVSLAEANMDSVIKKLRTGKRVKASHDRGKEGFCPTYYLRTHTKRDSIKKDKARSRSSDPDPVYEVQQLIDYFDREFLQRLGYSQSARYTQEMAIADAEDMIGKRSLKEWMACIDWVRHVKKGLARDEFMYKMKVFKLGTIRTCWNHYRDATRENRVPGQQTVTNENAYDNGKRK